jgi:hypothetical protein
MKCRVPVGFPLADEAVDAVDEQAASIPAAVRRVMSASPRRTAGRERNDFVVTVNGPPDVGT